MVVLGGGGGGVSYERGTPVLAGLRLEGFGDPPRVDDPQASPRNPNPLKPDIQTPTPEIRNPKLETRTP